MATDNGGRSSVGTVSKDLPRRDKTTIVINCYRSKMRKFPALLPTRLPDDSFTLPREAKSHIKNVLGLALSIFAIYLMQNQHTFSNGRFEHIRIN